MSNAFDKLNLRPFERRLVVAVGIILFVAVQFIYIWPHFGDVNKMNVRHEKAVDELKTRQELIAETNIFSAELAKLQGEGLEVPPEDQAVQLMRTIQTQSSRSGVQIQSTSKPFTRTNQFFLEQSQQVSTISEQEALVNFIYNLGTGDSLIRVRDLTIRPDQSRTKLNATIKVVASYQKSAARATPPAGRAPASASGQTRPAPGPASPKPSTPTKKPS